MKKSISLVCLIFIMVACKNSFSPKNDEISVDVHEVIAKAYINTIAYTYVRASENDTDKWIAIPLTKIMVGRKYYYQGGMLIRNFKSKELNRSFENILFLEGLSDDKENLMNKCASIRKNQEAEQKHENINTHNLKKITVNLKMVNGCVAISELYAHREQHSDKKVKVSGIVTKFSADIMKKNWVHLQDGTEYSGTFDLTITTAAVVAKGDTVTFEGKIILNKDFGYGYFYEVLLKDAVILNR
jgi:hypothetical protein